jgi:hypothetical protein
MNNDQLERLSRALHTADLPPGLHLDQDAVLATAKRTRRRRQLGTAVLGSGGVAAAAVVGIWAADLVTGPGGEISPVVGSEPSAGEEYAVIPGPDEDGTGDPGLQRAGEAAQQRHLDCLDDLGVPVERFADGSAQVGDTEGGAGQATATLSSIRLCAAQAGFPPAPERISDDEISDLYEAHLDTATCLQEHGFTPEPTVSREEFVNDYSGLQEGDEDVVPWSPFHGITDSGAVEQCPPADQTD